MLTGAAFGHLSLPSRIPSFFCSSTLTLDLHLEIGISRLCPG